METKLKKIETLTPEKIVSTLFMFHNQAHLYHLQTNTIGKHMLLDELYKGLVDMKDEIAEYLLGIQAPKRFGLVTMMQFPEYSDENMMDMLEKGYNFTVQLVEYGKNKGLEELVNLASELQQKFVKARLFTTYK